MALLTFTPWSQVGTQVRISSWVAVGCSLWLGLTTSEGQGTYQAELSSRQADATSAYGLLKSGDVAYSAGDYTTAVEDFRQALALVPAGSASATLRTELADRFATAASQESKALVKQGDLEGARAVLTQALGYAPDNGYALRQLDALDDPIRTNPALTTGHVADVDRVRRLLYKAEGAYNLGKFDEAQAQYSAVLKVDTHNKAARRGLERVAQATAEYSRAAYDHTRAAMLAEVDAAWDVSAEYKAAETAADSISTYNYEQGAARVALQQKLASITLPIVDIADGDLYEALSTLRELSRAYDTTTDNPAEKGVQFIAKFPTGAPEFETLASLTLTNVPLIKAVEAVATQFGLQFTDDGYAVTFSSLGSEDGAVFVKTYPVSPTFLTLQAGASATESADPFSTSATSTLGGTTLEGSRKTAQQVLESYGVKFGTGATATYLASTSTLILKNTEQEHQVVEALLEQLAQKQPLQVAIEVKFIEVSQDNAQELATDFSIAGTIRESILDGLYTGGSAGNGANFEDLAGRPLTSGNRSGGLAAGSDSIHDVIQRSKGGVAEYSSSASLVGLATGGTGFEELLSNAGAETTILNSAPAPGVLSVMGALGDGTVEALLRGLDQKKGADYILKPSFVTRSGQQAKVDIGREFIYPTEYDPPEIAESDTPQNDNSEEADNTAGWALVYNNLNQLVSARVGTMTYSDQSPAVTPSHPTSFDTTILGTELEILPTVSDDGQTVHLSVNATHREFEGFINYGTPIPGVSINVRIAGEIETEVIEDGTLQDDANDDDDDEGDFYTVIGDGLPPGDVVIDTRLFEAASNDILMPVFKTLNTETSVTVYDGATLILGGIIESTPVTVEDKTPILGDIPLVGKMFQSDVEHSFQKQVIIAITAKVLDPTGRPIKSSL